jgi:DNA-binding MarR family transcriptional regulator
MNNRARRRPRRPPAADALVFSLLGAAGAVEARLDAAVRPLGLSLAKTGVLMLLAEAGRPLPLSELAEHEGCVRSNITQLVDRLEKDGLVRRRGDPADGRSVRAALTRAGAQVYAKAVRALAQEQRAIVSALSAGEAGRLKAVLQLLAR